MSNLIGNTGWANFRAAMKDAHDTFHQKDIVWHRQKANMDRYGEDAANGYDTVILKAQLNYNYMRSWPVTFRTETGDLDRQSVQILLNKDYLRENGYINAAGYFVYDQSLDYFVIDGLKHVPMGDTPVSQAYEDDILFTIIVKRDDTRTGEVR